MPGAFPKSAGKEVDKLDMKYVPIEKEIIK